MRKWFFLEIFLATILNLYAIAKSNYPETYVDLCFGGWKTGGSNKYFLVRCNQYLDFILFFKKILFFEICEVGGLAIATRGFSQNWPTGSDSREEKKWPKVSRHFFSSSKCENSPKTESLPETNQGFGFLRLFFGFRASGWSRARALPATRGREGGRESAREKRRDE